MDENTASLKCPDCGGPMTPGEKRDNGRCQYCEDAVKKKPSARSTRGKCGTRFNAAIRGKQQGPRDSGRL